MTNTTTAKEIETAVAESAANDSIVHLPWSEGRETELTMLADDYTDAGDVLEAWGEDDDGATWRVHLDRHAIIA